MCRNSQNSPAKDRTIYVRQNHNILQQQLGDLSNSRLFQIKNEGIELLAVYPSGQWNPQTEMFFATPTIGKVGGASFRKDREECLIIIGLNKQGIPWTHIMMNLSSDPYEEWKTYKVTGKEKLESYAYELRPIYKFNVNAGVHTVQVYEKPVFVVTVKAAKDFGTFKANVGT